MIQNLRLDVVFSDPMMSMGFALLLLGLIGLIFSIIKFFAFEEPENDFGLPTEEEPQIQENGQEIPAPRQTEEPAEPAEEKTAIVPPEESEVRAGLDLALNSVSSLSRKMADVEDKIRALERVMEVKLETSELKELPQNAGEFASKLLKLAEHVIILEGEVANLKRKKQTQPKEIPQAAPPPAEKPSAPPTPSEKRADQNNSDKSMFEKTIVEPKPPIMPL